MGKNRRVDIRSTRANPSEVSALDRLQVDRREVVAAALPALGAPPDRIAFNPDNPREKLRNIDDLVESLRQEGQLEPATVMRCEDYLRHNPDAADAVGDADWVVIWGNRRLAAARKAGLPELRFVVVSGADNVSLTDLYVRAALENLEREGFLPSEEAHLCERLKRDLGSQSAVAKRLRRTEAWVSYRLRLVRLIPELLDQVDTGDLTIEQGRNLAKLTPQLQGRVLARELSAEAGATIGRRPEAEQEAAWQDHIAASTLTQEDHDLNAVKNPEESAPDLHGVKSSPDTAPITKPTFNAVKDVPEGSPEPSTVNGVKTLAHEKLGGTPQGEASSPEAEQLTLDLQWEPHTMAERLREELGAEKFGRLVKAGLELTR